MSGSGQSTRSAPAWAAEIGRLVTSTLDIETLFGRTVNLIHERFGFYHAAIFTIDETGYNAVLATATGKAGGEMLARQHSLAVGSKSIVGTVSSTGNPLVVNDVSVDPTYRPNPSLPDTKAEAAIPLRIGKRIIGVIDLQSKETDAFTTADIAVLLTLADQVAIAIDNARLFGEREKRLKSLQQISEKMVEASLNPDNVLGLVAQAANELSHSDLSSIYLSRAEINYRPWDNTRIQLSFRQLPYGGYYYYSPFSDPWYREGGF